MAYKPGDYYVCCDQCGFRKYASECRMQWDGLFVCADCYDEKHPQYTEPTGKHERQNVKIHRPEKDPTFLEYPYNELK